MSRVISEETIQLAKATRQGMVQGLIWKSGDEWLIIWLFSFALLATPMYLMAGWLDWHILLQVIIALVGAALLAIPPAAFLRGSRYYDKRYKAIESEYRAAIRPPQDG